MQTRTINAEHLELVLVTLRARRHNPKLARFAALSNGAYSTRSCTLRRINSDFAAPHTAHARPPVMLPLLPSVPTKLVDRVRLNYGLAEVKRTWGIGYRAMLAEVSPKSGGLA